MRAAPLAALLLLGCQQEIHLVHAQLPDAFVDGIAVDAGIDSAGGDLAALPDRATAPPDQGLTTDLATSADRTPTPDLEVSIDAAVVLDLTAPPGPDLDSPEVDLAAPHDLLTPGDLARPLDFATPGDFARPLDSATPGDLAHPPDLGAPPSPPRDWVFYDSGVGLTESIIDATPDDAGNVWAVSYDALYILRPKDGFFHRYTNAEGLHISKWITAVAGAGSNEGYVGLEGTESDDPNDDPPELKQLGKAEHVHLFSDGSIMSLQYANLHNDNSANYWETRSARRLLYAHEGPNAGHLFLGGNHGITHILNDGWGDHIHVDIRETNGSQLLGEFYGLALDPGSGGLWTCGGYGCGLQKLYADPRTWVGGSYQWAFTVFTGNHDLTVPHGYREDFVAVAVAADGVVYFLSKTKGMASWDPRSGSYAAIGQRGVPGMGFPVDVVADPDGTLWVADGDHMIRWTPATGQATTLPVPSTSIRRLYMDATVHPRALYIATGNGLGIYRGP